MNKKDKDKALKLVNKRWPTNDERLWLLEKLVDAWEEIERLKQMITLQDRIKK